MVIGKAGATVRAIQDETGAGVRVSNERDFPDRRVVVRGTAEQVGKAEQKLTSVVMEWRSANGGGRLPKCHDSSESKRNFGEISDQ